MADDNDIEVHLPLNMQPQAVVRLFLATIYNAWPSNVLAFVREPVKYAEGKELQPLYDVPWSEVYPKGSLASRSGPLLRNFHLHPSLVEHTSKAEIEDQSRWDRTSPGDFIAQAHTLAHAELLVDQHEELQPLGDGAEFVDPASESDSGLESVRLRREVSLLRAEQNIHLEVQSQYLYREQLDLRAPGAPVLRSLADRHWPIAP